MDEPSNQPRDVTSQGDRLAPSFLLNEHLDEVLLLLIKVLEIGEPYVTGYTKPLWVTHRIRLCAQVAARHDRAAAGLRGLAEVQSLHQTLLELVHELKCIQHLINEEIIPRVPGLAKAIRSTGQKIQLLLSSFHSMTSFASNQEQLFAWGTSLLATVMLLGEVLSPAYLYTLCLWPDELDGTCLVVKRTNFPKLEVGDSKAIRADQLPAKEALAPTGGITKFIG